MILVYVYLFKFLDFYNYYTLSSSSDSHDCSEFVYIPYFSFFNGILHASLSSSSQFYKALSSKVLKLCVILQILVITSWFTLFLSIKLSTAPIYLLYSSRTSGIMLFYSCICSDSNVRKCYPVWLPLATSDIETSNFRNLRLE